MDSAVTIAPDSSAADALFRQCRTFLIILLVGALFMVWLGISRRTLPGAWVLIVATALPIGLGFRIWRASQRDRRAVLSRVTVDAQGVQVVEPDGSSWSAGWHELHLRNGPTRPVTLVTEGRDARSLPLVPTAAGASTLFGAIDRWLPERHLPGVTVVPAPGRYHIAGPAAGAGALPLVTAFGGYGIVLNLLLTAVILGLFFALRFVRRYHISAEGVEEVTLMGRRHQPLDAVRSITLLVDTTNEWQLRLEVEGESPWSVRVRPSRLAEAYVALRAYAPAGAARRFVREELPAPAV